MNLAAIFPTSETGPLAVTIPEITAACLLDWQMVGVLCR